jgi:hypothetical protein
MGGGDAGPAHFIDSAGRTLLKATGTCRIAILVHTSYTSIYFILLIVIF